MRVSCPRIVGLWLLLGAASALAQADAGVPFRLGLASFESTSPKFPASEVLRPMAAAFKKRAGERAAKFTLVEPGEHADITLSAKLSAKAGKYSVVFELAADGEPELTSRVVYPPSQPRLTLAAARGLAGTLVELAGKLELKRRAKALTRPPKVEPPPEPEPEPAEAAADESPPVAEEEPDPLFRFALRGFVQALGVAAAVDDQALLHGIVGLRPSPRAFLQANLQPQLKLRGDFFSLDADLSLLGSTSAPNGLFLINELYANARWGPVRVLVGRRRVVWGSGLAVNPTDLLNPQKDALTPELQRAGALLLPMVDVTFGNFTLTGLVSLGLDTNAWAIPKGVQTDKAIFAARGYALLFGTDLNLMYFRDQQHRRNLFGLAASRFIGDWVEVHVEGLIRASRPELPALPAVPGCGEPLTARSGDWTGTALVGARVHFEDQGLLVAEYFYNGDGLDSTRYDQLKNQAPCLAAAVASVGGPTVDVPAHPLGFPSEQLFLVREHHVFITYERPHLDKGLFEDVSLTGGLILSPVDFSAILQAGAGYNFSGRASVTLRVLWWVGGKNSELGAWPARVLGLAGFKLSF